MRLMPNHRDPARSLFPAFIANPPLWLVVGTAAVMILIGVVLFSSSGRDDVYITYWSAHSLATTGEIVNYSGERVEQSSSLLHVLLLALLQRITGLPLQDIGPIFSLISGIGVIVVSYPLARQVVPSLTYGVIAFLATSAGLLYWSLSAFDATLAALASVILITTYGALLADGDADRRRYLLAALATALLLLTRPEMPFVIGGVILGALIYGLIQPMRRPDASPLPAGFFRRVAFLFGIAALLTLILFAWRGATFGSLFPQPVYAKVGGVSLATLRAGITYLVRYLAVPRVMLITAILIAVGIAAAAVALFNGAFNAYQLFSLLFLIVYAAFIVLAGGDWMESGRLLVPLLPAATLFLLRPVADLAARSRRAAYGLLLLMMLAQVWSIWQVAARQSTGMPLWEGIRRTSAASPDDPAASYNWFERTNRTHLRDIPTIAALDRIVGQVSPHAGDELVIMSRQMGMIPFYVVQGYGGDLRMVDQLGLVSRDFTACPLTASLARRPQGIQPMSYRFYFENREAFSARCGVPEPDIIYDVGAPPDVLSAHGYTTVYTQRGRIANDTRSLPGGEVLVDQWIAVRSDLLPYLEEPSGVHVTIE